MSRARFTFTNSSPKSSIKVESYKSRRLLSDPPRDKTMMKMLERRKGSRYWRKTLFSKINSSEMCNNVMSRPYKETLWIKNGSVTILDDNRTHIGVEMRTINHKTCRNRWRSFMMFRLRIGCVFKTHRDMQQRQILRFKRTIRMEATYFKTQLKTTETTSQLTTARPVLTHTS